MGNKIKEAREKVCMTQEDVALKSGLSCSTISGLESGQISSTTLKTLARIADALEMTLDEMFGFKNVEVIGGAL